MEIKVGEYVRTKNGTIRKIAETLNNIVIADKPYYEPYCETEAISKRDIVKHSKNIINLIEVGDYVNGRIVEDIVKTDKKHILYCNGDYVAGGIQKNEIKSVVTKEQFSSLEYII